MRCVECQKKYTKIRKSIYESTRKKEKSEYDVEYRKKNHSKIAEHRRKHYQENRTILLAKMAIYRSKWRALTASAGVAEVARIEAKE